MSDRLTSCFWGPTSRANDGTEVVAPPFASPAQASIFLAVVLLCLVLPKLIDLSGLISRSDAYDIMPEKTLGAFSFVKGEIFENADDIDLLFVGSSVIFAAIDTPRVQEALSASLGRPARVRTFGHYFSGAGTDYLQVKDLLERKQVRMIVLTVPRMPYPDGPSGPLYRFAHHDEAAALIADLPYRYQAALYACNVLRSPRDLLTIIRPNLPSASPWAKELGADKAYIGQNRDPLRFEKFSPDPPTIEARQLIYSAETRENYEFLNDPIGPYQDRFFSKTVELIRSKNVPVVMINIPQSTERRNTKIRERQDWSRKFSADIPLIGIPPAVLFKGLSDEEIDKLYFDPAHFNANGNEFFTRAILPAIVEEYNEHAAKD